MTDAGLLSRLYRGIAHVVVASMLFAFTMLTAQGGNMPGGIGGTGFHPGGIGGTGIIAVGPIQRFGSVFVLGKEYHFTPQTKFVIDGAASTKQQLRLGAAVAVTGKWENGHWVAQQVEANSALIGRIDHIDRERQRIQVLGQTVKITRQTRLYPGDRPAASSLRSLQPGDLIRISALGHDPEGWIAAAVTRIPPRIKSPANQTLPLLLRGPIQALAANRQAVRIGGTWFTLAKPLATRFAAGQYIVASGHYVSSGPLLTHLKPDLSTAAGVGKYIELYGLIQKTAEGVYCNDYRLEGNTAIALGTNTHPSTAWGLVEGRITAPGVITSDRIAPQIDPMVFDLSAVHDPQGAQHEAASSKPGFVKPDTDHGTERHTIKTPETSSFFGDHPEGGVPDASSGPSISPAPPEPGIRIELPDHALPSVSVEHPDTFDKPDYSPPPIPSTPTIPSVPSVPSAPSVPSVPSVPSAPSVPSVPSIPSIPAAPPEIPELPESPN
ncbi:MAG TPA: DUF5666 domain-containing protein [Halothiobacillus sp.]|nr:DUF5666 domain-containing protein [Halothiobacillus sp.]